jgi:hypothetical protein
MSGGDALFILLAPYQSLSLTCGFLFDSLGEIVRFLESFGLVGLPKSPFKVAREELVRIGTVAGSIEFREGAIVRGVACDSATELVVRWAIPSSMKRLLRCPSGSWPVVVGSDTVEDVEESDSAAAGAVVLLRLRGCVCVKGAEDMRCRGTISLLREGRAVVESQQGG